MEPITTTNNAPECDAIDSEVTKLRVECSKLAGHLSDALHDLCDVRGGLLVPGDWVAAFAALGWPESGLLVSNLRLCDVPYCGNRWTEDMTMPDGSYRHRCTEHAWQPMSVR